jgi:hypothetical protein
MDFNEAKPQRNFDLIPSGTVCSVRMKVRPGGAGEGGWLRRAKDGASEQLDCEFTVQNGEFEKRKFWTLFTVAGTTPGHAEAADISARVIRAILESARGVKPSDTSDAAKAARRIDGYGDLDGLTFVARIGISPPHNGYEAKNKLDRVITPDEVAWRPVQQERQAAPAAKPAATPAAIGRPAWAS